MVLPAATGRKLEAGQVSHCCVIGHSELIVYACAVMEALARRFSNHDVME